jgi:hypothetical protein
MHFVDAALHIEVAFRDVVELAVEDHLESAHRVLDRDILAGGAGEDLGNVERLGKETLDLAGAIDGEFVLGGELIQTQNRDDVLEILVTLENALHLAGDEVVLFADDIGCQALEVEASGSTAG